MAASSVAQRFLLRGQLAAEEVALARMPLILTGISKHGVDQIISRDGVGVATRAILDAFKNPIAVMGQTGGRFILAGKDAVIVINAEGKLITAWARGSAGFRLVL